MSFGKLYTYPNNPRVQKSLIAAKYNGLKVDEVVIAMGTDNKTPEFLAKFPLGKVPTFEGADGFCLYESNAIAAYVAGAKENSPLLGKTKKDQALVNQYMGMADNEFSAIAAAWLYSILGYYPFNAEATEKAKANAQKILESLNRVLATKTFLVGERVTLADIVLVCTLVPFYKMVFDAPFTAPFKNVNRWFLTCVNQPEFKAVLGEVEICKKMMVPGDVVKPAAVADKPKVAKAAVAPKAAPKAAAPKDDDDEEKVAPKPKNPLDLLPKSSMNLDEWKRCYSNNETRPTALNWFWEHLDLEGYTVWKADYKYNDELTQVFMSSNLVGGFFQRLDCARKYAFGSMLILGEDGNNAIRGYFVIRGKEMISEFLETVDYESYTFTKADTTDKKVRDDIDAIFAWDDKIGGKVCADGKTFK
jgi:elongation factor 1-gamma